MKRIHSILMAVVVLVVSSCVSKSEINDLQKQINELKTGKIATIEQSIAELDKDLRKEMEDAIKDSENSMKGWVNEQPAGYYTIAQMDAKLKALSDADAANEQAIGKVASDLASAKTELTEAYTKAITDAITKYNGEITAKIAADIRTATDALQAQIDALDVRVSALEGMIQSITIIPEYSDGSVMVEYDGTLTLNCIVSPTSSVKNPSTDCRHLNYCRHPKHTFWSDGYFVCSIGEASPETVRRYIENQG